MYLSFYHYLIVLILWDIYQFILTLSSQDIYIFCCADMRFRPGVHNNFIFRRKHWTNEKLKRSMPFLAILAYQKIIL